MDPLRVIAEEQGVFLTSEARDLGYDDRSIAASVRGRLWHRVRRGAFTFVDVWAASTPEQRHVILARAVMRSYGERVALSHVSAALVHGIAIWDVALSRVHITRLDGGAGRTEPDVVHHEGGVADEDLVTGAGMLLVAPVRAAFETATTASSEAALVIFDSLLHLRLADHDALLSLHLRCRHWPHSQHLHVPVRMADGRADSPGESRCRQLFFTAGLPAPELQFEVFDRGRLVGITDFRWEEHRLMGEFDGRVKYGRLLRPGQSANDVVFEEKQREDRLREVTGFTMVRIVWSDLARPGETAARVRRLMNRAAA
ncbi:MAG: hypothetical protein ACR2FG_14355 [Marmoricola sp.]